MKKALFLVSIILVLFSCKKESIRAEILIDSPPEKILSRDTILSGNFWEFAIGQSPEQVYSTIQNTRPQRQIKYLSIVNNIFTDITALEPRIGLYNYFFLDETTGTPDGIQVYFQEEKIKSIYTNSGSKMNQWPATGDSFIKPGDRLDSTYGKLLVISKLSQYSSKFQRISLFSKDMEKGYDPGMSRSAQWWFTAAVTENAKGRWLVELNFTNGKLSSVYATLSEMS